jgi:hypothetical protein
MRDKNSDEFGDPHVDQQDVSQRNEDPLDVWYDHCDEHTRDPYDVQFSTTDSSREVAQTAKLYSLHRLFAEVVDEDDSSPLKDETYPMDLCIYKDEIPSAKARQCGVDFIERRFIRFPNGQRHDGNSSILGFSGILYTRNVNYHHEEGDFVSWAMTLLSISHCLYWKLWLECTRHTIRSTFQFVRNMAQDIQHDFGIAALRRTIQRTHTDDSKCARSIKDFMDNGVYTEYWGHIHKCLQAFENNEEWLGLPYGLYLYTLIPIEWTELGQEDTTQNAIPLCDQLHAILNLASFMVEFGEILVPSTLSSTSTIAHRRITLRVHLQNGFSLMTFNPHWKCEPDLSTPKRTGSNTDSNARRNTMWPRMYSHRNQKYVKFLSKLKWA